MRPLISKTQDSPRFSNPTTLGIEIQSPASLTQSSLAGNVPETFNSNKTARQRGRMKSHNAQNLVGINDNHSQCPGSRSAFCPTKEKTGQVSPSGFFVL